MSKKTTMNEQIAEIRKMALENIPMMMKNPEATYTDYKLSRIQLNLSVISILVGGELEKSKDKTEWKMNFNRRLPNRAELAEIIEVVETFVRDIENPLIDTISTMSGSDDVDMDIPPRMDAINLKDNKYIPKIEKINSKKLKNYIFGYDGKDAMSRVGLTASDCMKIAAMGEELRKKTNRNTMLIVGGIALLLIGGTAAAVYINNRKKDEDLVDMSIDLESDDIPSVDIDGDDDVPMVTID